ncbi:hypothetical protein ACE6H2_008353 [Prunus campanulata]
MVRIHVKHGDGSDQKEFLYDCSTTSPIEEIAPEISRISDLQSRIDRLVFELEPHLEPLHGDAKAVSLLRALSEAKSYASKTLNLVERIRGRFVGPGKCLIEVNGYVIILEPMRKRRKRQDASEGPQIAAKMDADRPRHLILKQVTGLQCTVKL